MTDTKKSINYSDIWYSYFNKEDSKFHDKAEIHFLMYVISGQVTAEENGREYFVRAGECVFVCRDHRVKFTKNLLDEQPFKSVTLKFNRNFLRQYYQNLQQCTSIPKDAKKLQSSVFVLPKSPYIDSLFLSMIPFFESEMQPREDMIRQRMEEGVDALLNIDKGFYPALFDFADPWKIDILDFLNQNYMCDLTMEEIATFTGRSLATFKRDFKKVSHLSPQKWLIRKRLEKAYELVREGRKVTEVCHDVGFKNRSHFTTVFKKQYGFAPNSIQMAMNPN